jgi:hypothetical protein
MSKFLSFLKNNVLLIGVSAVIIFAGILFLTSNSDGATLTGAQAIAQDKGFYGNFFAFTGLTVVAVYFAARRQRKVQDGSDIGFWAWIVAAIVLFSIAVGRGCTDKASSQPATTQAAS